MYNTVIQLVLPGVEPRSDQWEELSRNDNNSNKTCCLDRECRDEGSNDITKK